MEVIAAGARLLKELDLADSVVLRPPTRSATAPAATDTGARSSDTLTSGGKACPLTRSGDWTATLCAYWIRRPRKIGRLQTKPLACLIFLTGNQRISSQRCGTTSTRWGISYEIDPMLVRGLDYYMHTTFEFVTDRLGAQGAVLAGGRYDGLTERMGGPALAGTGWAAGIERLALLAGDALPAATRPVLVACISAAATAQALQCAEALRNTGLATELALQGSLKRQLRHADRIGARAAVLLGGPRTRGGSGLGPGSGHRAAVRGPVRAAPKSLVGDLQQMGESRLEDAFERILLRRQELEAALGDSALDHERRVQLSREHAQIQPIAEKNR